MIKQIGTSNIEIERRKIKNVKRERIRGRKQKKRTENNLNIMA